MKNPFSLRSGMSIKKRVILLLSIVFVPFLLLETHVFHSWFQKRKASELQANLELARAVSINFETFLHGLIHNELALGLALTGSRPVPDKDRGRILDELAADYPAIRGLYWINPAGVVIASSVRSHIGVNLKDRSYFREVTEGQDRFVSELFIGRVTGKPVFAVSRAIRAENGALLGVVAATIEPDRLSSGILGVHRSADAGVSLIDNKGMHVTRFPPTDYTWEERNWRKLYPVLEESLRGRETTAVVTSPKTGKLRLTAFVPVPSTGWVVASSRAENDVTAAVFKVLMPQIGLTLVLTMIAAGAAVGLSRPITRSIFKMKEHAEALGRGGTERIVPEGPLELKTLADTLNEMAEKVRSREQSLAASEKKYRELIETANSIILRWDNQGSIRFINDFGLRFFGYAAEELIGRDVMTIVPRVEKSSGRDLDALVKDIVLHPENHTYVSSENIKKDGSTVWVAWTNKVIRDEQGNVSEILTIGNDITALKEAEEALQASLAEKEVLLKEIHHRVKNNLQLVSSLLDLQAQQAKDPAVREIFGEVIQRVHSMAMVHEKLYRSLDMAQVEFAGYAETLLEQLWRAQGPKIIRIGMEMDLKPVHLPVNEAVPCGLILNELFSNAIKHAFHGRSGGTVSISLCEEEEGTVALSVRDDGVGLPQGTDWEKSKSLGLRLVGMLARQLRAEVEVRSGEGTRFTIRFRKREDAGD